MLVTGASSGIGLCIARGLRGRGYRVFATVRNPEDAERLRAEGLSVLLLDLARPESIRHAVAQVLEQAGGRLYGLVNNGAFGQPGAVEDLTREALRQQFEVNVFGTQELTNLLLPIMRKQGHGRIIQMSSVLGFIALRYRGAYTASKFALEALSDTMRLELAGTGVHVVLIEPGPIESQFRTNAKVAFTRNVNSEHSPHRDVYADFAKHVASKGSEVWFTLPPEAVYKKVLKALESDAPKPRYYVTIPTHVFGFLKRLLPARWLDYLFMKI